MPQALEEQRLDQVGAVEAKRPFRVQVEILCLKPYLVGRIESVGPLLQVDVLRRKLAHHLKIVANLGLGHLRKRANAEENIKETLRKEVHLVGRKERQITMRYLVPNFLE